MISRRVNDSSNNDWICSSKSMILVLNVLFRSLKRSRRELLMKYLILRIENRLKNSFFQIMIVCDDIKINVNLYCRFAICLAISRTLTIFMIWRLLSMNTSSSLICSWIVFSTSKFDCSLSSIESRWTRLLARSTLSIDIFENSTDLTMISCSNAYKITYVNANTILSRLISSNKRNSNNMIFTRRAHIKNWICQDFKRFVDFDSFCFSLLLDDFQSRSRIMSFRESMCSFEQIAK